VLRLFGAGEDTADGTAWFEKDAPFDAEVSKRFLPLHEELVAGAWREWLAQRAGLPRAHHRARPVSRGIFSAARRARLPPTR